MSDPATDRILAKAAEEAARRNAIAAIDMATNANGKSLEVAGHLSSLAAATRTLQDLVGEFNRLFGMAMQRITNLEAEVAALQEADNGVDD